MGRSGENCLSLLENQKVSVFCAYDKDYNIFRAKVHKENLFSHLGFKDIEKCVFMDQIHSNKVEIYDENLKNLSCDGLISIEKNTALCVLSADCLPLILWHESGIIAALHSGRKGSFENILKELSEQRIQIQSSIENLDIFLKNTQLSISSLMQEINNYKEQSLNTVENISKLSANLEESYTKSSEKLINDISEYVGKFNTELSTHNEKINTQLIEGLNSASASINSQIKTLDQELENVLKNLGSNLASISTKFVDDYNTILSNLSSLNQKMSNLR
ncbi:hypothetical protein E7723_05305 [Campylobacter coli]|nr:hypothetical protein [Campylobacter coli]